MRIPDRHGVLSSGILPNIYCWFIADVSEQPTLDCLALEEGTVRLSRNVGDKLAMYVGLNPRRVIISYIRRQKPEIKIGIQTAFENCTVIILCDFNDTLTTVRRRFCATCAHPLLGPQ
jgi:hypothetical protein